MHNAVLVKTYDFTKTMQELDVHKNITFKLLYWSENRYPEDLCNTCSNTKTLKMKGFRN